MIKVKNINGSPASNPKTKFGVHSDSSYFYFFESNQERENFISSLPEQEVIEIKEKIDLSNIDIDSLTDEQIDKLKQRFGM